MARTTSRSLRVWGSRRRRLVSGVVGSWKGLAGLADEDRPGGPRSVSDERVEQVVVDTLERTPRDATHWSRSAMAAETGLSKSTIGRIWRAFGLKPHLVETFKLSTIRYSSRRSATWSGST